MKYTARHIQRYLETGKIDPLLWKNRFLSILPSHVPTCEECSEFLDRACAGGRDPVDCLISQVQVVTPVEKQKQKKRDPMLGLGARGPELRKTAQPRDQSKM